MSARSRCHRRPRSRAAERAAAELGSGVIGLGLDVADRGSFAAFLDAAETVAGPVDVLVNNAGIMPTGQFLDETEAMTDRIIDINVHGVVTGSRLAAERFTRRGRGHIVNVASLAGVTGEPGVATYCGSKHFVVGFSESLYREMRPYGVGVSTILPGVINTELSGGAQVPRWARRLVGAEPEDVAAAVVGSVARGRIRTSVPAVLGTTLAATRLLPDRMRFAILRAARFDELMSGADPSARERYHRRLSEQSGR